jgi:hypothetical protein
MQEKLHADTEFTHLLSLLPNLHMQQGPWITGGSARKLWCNLDWHVGDVDVFFVNEAQRVSWLAEFDKVWNYTYHKPSVYETPVDVLFGTSQGFPMGPKKQWPQASMIMETENACTFEMFYQMPGDSEVKNCKLQVIKARYSDSLQDLWKTFDFNLCCFAADATRVYADTAAITDVELNQITPRNDVHSRNLPLRVLKHFSQGYHVDDQLLMKAVRQIADKEMDWCNNY